MRDGQFTFAFFLLCLLAQAQEARIRRLEQFNADLARRVDELTPKQTEHPFLPRHLRRVK